MVNIKESSWSLHIYQQLSWEMKTQYFLLLLNMNLLFYSLAKPKNFVENYYEIVIR